jgi:hypothetical protein
MNDARFNANVPGIARWLLGGGREHVGIVLGSDTAGKTTFLYRLKFKEAVQTLPTIGFNIETIDYPDGEKVTLWDVGGKLPSSAHDLS